MADKQTADKTRVEDGAVSMKRRTLLSASAVAVAALAGCTGADGKDSSDFDGSTAEAVEVVEEFYAAYNNEDIEKANTLATDDYADEYTLTPEDFEQWGGIGAMSWTIDDIAVERESEEMVEVHAEVTVEVPSGSGKNEDYFIVVKEDGEWRYDEFLPEQDRNGMSQEEIDQRMQRDWE